MWNYTGKGSGCTNSAVGCLASKRPTSSTTASHAAQQQSHTQAHKPQRSAKRSAEDQKCGVPGQAWGQFLPVQAADEVEALFRVVSPPLHFMQNTGGV